MIVKVQCEPSEKTPKESWKMKSLIPSNQVWARNHSISFHILSLVILRHCSFVSEIHKIELSIFSEKMYMFSLIEKKSRFVCHLYIIYPFIYIKYI